MAGVGAGSGDAGERERQRVAYLVLGRSRPREKKPKKARKSKQPTPPPPPPPLGSIEERVTLRERWSHKKGTPETLEHAALRREGAIARLYLSEAIDGDQLAAAEAIVASHAATAADVRIRTASLEARIDRGGRDGQFFEALAAVRREIAYTRWRTEVAAPAAMLEIIVDDLGLTIVAARHRMGVARTKRLLIDALDLWWRIHAGVRREIDPNALDAAQARILG